MPDKRPAPELEFVAKRVNDLCEKVLPNRDLGYMTFVFDQGDGGYIGYLSSCRRIDAFRMITKWMERSLKGFSRKDVVEMLRLYETELAKEEISDV